MSSSSLVTSASTWINDENSNKKRTPTLRKTIKMRPNITSVEEPDEYITQSENYQNLQPSTVNDIQAASHERNSRVNDLLNKITSADTQLDNNKLGNFKPLDPPSLNAKKDMNDNTDHKKYVLPTMSFADASIANKESKYGANDTPSAIYSNYMKSYEPPAKLTQNQPYYAKMGLGNQSIDDKLMEKINYMIHLLEEQQNEKTNNITEEFILYTFLGVFMIFLVDSFARSGKYTR